VDDSPATHISIGTTSRAAHDGLHTTITDNPVPARFEILVGDAVVGWQPYRRYGNHIVLMSTEIDEQWRGRGISSALIDGVLGLIRSAGHTVVPRCKLTGDYVFRHPQYRDLVADQYQALVRPIWRPGAGALPEAAT
jgi:predicted GNAT family acetyltransferase